MQDLDWIHEPWAIVLGKDGERSEEDIQCVVEWIESMGISFFQTLPREVLRVVCNHLHVMEFHAGDVIIRQGAVGRSFFVLVNGTVSIHIRNEEEDDPPEVLLGAYNAKNVENAFGKQVNVLGKGAGFGELALLSNVMRTASILAREYCVCVTLDKDGYNKALRQVHTAKLRDRTDYLRDHFLSKRWSEQKRVSFAYAMKRREVARGAHIFSQGEARDSMSVFFVERGECAVSCTVPVPNPLSLSAADTNEPPYYNEHVPVASLGPGGLAGEEEVLGRMDAYQTTLTATCPTAVYEVKGSQFRNFVRGSILSMVLELCRKKKRHRAAVIHAVLQRHEQFPSLSQLPQTPRTPRTPRPMSRMGAVNAKHQPAAKAARVRNFEFVGLGGNAKDLDEYERRRSGIRGYHDHDHSNEYDAAFGELMDSEYEHDHGSLSLSPSPSPRRPSTATSAAYAYSSPRLPSAGVWSPRRSFRAQSAGATRTPASSASQTSSSSAVTPSHMVNGPSHARKKTKQERPATASPTMSRPRNPRMQQASASSRMSRSRSRPLNPALRGLDLKELFKARHRSYSHVPQPLETNRRILEYEETSRRRKAAKQRRHKNNPRRKEYDEQRASTGDAADAAVVAAEDPVSNVAFRNQYAQWQAANLGHRNDDTSNLVRELAHLSHLDASRAPPKRDKPAMLNSQTRFFLTSRGLQLQPRPRRQQRQS